MSGLADHAYAARFRDWARRVIRTEISRLLPGDRYGTITDIDYTAMKCDVEFLGSDEVVTVPFGVGAQPTHEGQRVRVSGGREDRYVADAATLEWIAPTFQNSWVNYGSSYEVAGYRRTPDGLILLRGLIKDGTVGSAAFTLPEGYRPLTQHIFCVIDGTNSGVRVDVKADGTVVPRSGLDNSFVSLAGIAFDGI